MTSQNFGTLPTGETIEQHTLTNPTGASLDVITYGGIITALRMPDANGVLADVVLGYDKPRSLCSPAIRISVPSLDVSPVV